MANEEHLARLKEGVAVWNAWRKEHPEIRPDLTGLDLSDAKLRSADLSFTNLTNSDLSFANLRNASLTPT